MQLNLLPKAVNRLKKSAAELFFTRSFGFFQRLGVHVLPVHYYSPIPDTRALVKDKAAWSKDSDMYGIDLRLQAEKRLLVTVSGRYKDEYSALPRHKTSGPPRYYLDNGTFGFVSGQMHYAMVRHFKPSRIIEVGSGMSTLVTMEAMNMNRKDGRPGELVCVEPYPPGYLEATGVTILKKPVERLNPDIFSNLSDNDMLFIDSSHTVKIGGDVNFLMFDVLPRLKSGVIVHIHDINFPREYFESYILKDRIFWQEQYLVQAFLMFNKAFEVLWCASYMHHKHPELLKEAFSPYPPERVPTSLYIRKVA